MPPIKPQPFDLQSFVVEYERRHAALETKFAVQSAEQKMRDEQTAKELACLHEGIDDIKKILSNGLLSRVTSLEAAVNGVAARVASKPRLASWDFWSPIFRDFVRVSILIGVMIALQNASKFLGAFGIQVP